MHVRPLKKEHSIKRERKFRWKIVFVTLIVNAMAYALVTWTLAQSRQHYQESAETSAKNIARHVKKSVVDTLANIEMNLLETKLEIERQQTNGNINDAALNAFLKRLHKRLPEMSSIRVVNASGIILHDSSKASAPEAHINDREYFQFLRDHPSASLYISKPLLDRSSGDRILILSQRFDHPDGSFAGVLNGTVSLRHFQQLFSAPEIGAQGLVSLRNDKLGIIASHPKLPETDTGASSRNTAREWQELLRSARHEWLINDPSSEDGVNRTTAVRKVANFPLYISVGLAPDDYFEEWWQAVATANESLLLFTLMSALLSLLFYHTRLDRMLVVAYRCSRRTRPCRRTGFYSRANDSASSRFRATL